MTSHIDFALVERSIGFHGAPMQKIWEGERGESDLARGDVKPDFTAYQSRQKHFVFQDRAKRLKLHQFLARKAPVLFRKSTKSEIRLRQQAIDGDDVAKPLEGVVAVTRPFYTFFNEILDKSAQLQRIFSLLNVGDIVYGVVQNRTANGLIAKVLCTREPNFHFLQDLGAKALLSNSEMVPAGDRKNGFAPNDHIICEILELTPDSEKMMLGMRGLHRNPALDGQITFGLTSLDQFPAAYKALTFGTKQQYNAGLESAPEFQNPYSLDHLYTKLGLDSQVLYSNMSGVRGRYPSGEYSTELRQTQASKWAFRSVAEGIEHFKEGRHSEAFQCLNNALNIDPRNVEGLVARGALYANSGSFKKAVDDFETALKLNSSHANARKYMGETLVALGRSYEDESNIEEAKNAYQSCLNIIPTHEEAKNSLEFLWSKASKNLIDTNELTLPALNLKIADQKRGDKKEGSSRAAKKSKKKKSKGRKRDTSSSSSDSSDSSDSSSGSNSSDDSTSSSDSDYSKSKKKRRGRSANRHTKQKSLSPLSKRMASMVSDSNAPSNSRPILPNTYSYDQSFSYNQPDDYELEVRKYLERTREEDNYEEKVRHFIEEANKYRKDRKGSDDKSVSKKREKRKSRKSKKDSKKKRKEKRSKSSKKEKDDEDPMENMEFREALKIFKSLPGLDMSEKLQSVEKSLALHKETQKQEDNKWKMMFVKDASKPPINPQTLAAPSTSKFVPKQYAFANEDDESEDGRLADSRSESKSKYSAGSSNAFARKASPERPAKRDASPAPYITNIRQTAAAAPKPTVLGKAPIGPVVMDKFGSFRLATADPPISTTSALTLATPGVPPVLASTQRAKGSQSRSRSRRRYSSDSRSRSRSQKRRSGSRPYRRRGSRSRSFERKSSRSRSGSYSRSRSRSNSNDRRRGGDRRLRGNRMGGSGNGTYYKPRFNNNFRDNNFRGNNQQNRGVGFRGGYRDNYNNQNSSNYRGYNNRFNNNNNGNNNNRGRWVNRGGGNMNNRFRSYDNDYRGRRIDRDSRSRSFDDDDRRRSMSADDTNRPSLGGDGSDRRSASKATRFSNDGERRASSLEQIEDFIDKAKKEKKEEMLERNQDIKKNINN